MEVVEKSLKGAQRKLQLIALAFVVLMLNQLFSCIVFAEENPVAPPPEVQTLSISKDVPGGNVVLNWSDGMTPFAVERSESKNFLAPTNLTYVTRSTPSGPVNDPVLNDGKTYYYLVSDANSPTQVYSIQAAAGTGIYEDDDLIIDGVGFDQVCNNNSVYYEGGLSATLLTCSSTQIQAEVPVHSISGNIIVVSPNGQSTAQRKLFAVGLRSNPAKELLAHVNVDADHNIFACDQGASDRIWKISFLSSAASTCTTFANPVGLPKNENGRFMFGNDTWSSSNAGTVRELEPSSCTYTTWGTSGQGSSDPVDPRALAYDKSGANNGWIFLLDHWGDRIRKKANGAGLDTQWLTNLGLGGDSAAASRPAGFTFNTAGEFFFTAQSKIKHYSGAKTLIQEFTSADGLNHPAQIETDEDNTLWVANRDGNNILRIRTSPTNRLVRTKLSGITSPRGLALDRDPDTNNPWLYVADEKEVYRFRIYDTVRVDVKVFNETLISPSGIQTSQAEFERRVKRDIEQMRTIFSQCHLDIVVERILFIPDPNVGDGSVESNRSATLTAQEQTVLATQRATDPLVINIYYIHHFLQPNSTPPPNYINADLNGRAYSNDSIPGLNNQTEGGIMIARFSAMNPGESLSGGAIDNTVAHELGHFLLDQYVQPGYTDEHRGAGCLETDPDRFYLMHGTGCLQRYSLTNGAGSECENMRTSPDGSIFVELF
ncbi:MAG: hypothetical protein AB1756_04230 [Acidobacteriota bacterium]